MVDCNSTLTRFVFQIPQNQRKWTESWFVSFLWRCLLPQWLTRQHRRDRRSKDNGAMENEILRFVGLRFELLDGRVCVSVRGAVHTTPEELRNAAFSLWTQQWVFSIYVTPKTQHAPVNLDLRLKTCSVKSHNTHVATIFENCRFQSFPSLGKRIAGVFQIFPVWRAFFEKLRFRERLVWTVSILSNFSGVVWTLP